MSLEPDASRGRAFKLGVNYWPRRKAMAWWSDFDFAEVEDDFDLLKELGLGVVRLFLLWEHWQPTPDAVSRECLADLRRVADAAAERGLGLDVTFFTGHMSGPNWAPAWLLDVAAPPPAPGIRQVVSGGQPVTSGYRNMFHDPTALAAQRLLLTEVVSELRDHPGVWLWNLGNEPDLFAWPQTPASGAAWVGAMTALIKRLDPERDVTCGLHVASLLQDNRLRVDDVFGATDVAVMHAYPMYLPWARHELDPDLVPFTCALVSALCGKPTLMEEWGGCTAPPGEASQVWEWRAYGETRRQFMAGEDALAEYVATVLPKLVEVGATGSLLWCFADYREDLWDRPPLAESRHERHFGLVRPDGSLKPHAEVVKAFAATAPRVAPAARSVTLDVTSEEFYAAPAEHAVRLFHKYLERYAP